MARQNQKDIYLKNKKLLKGKINENNRQANWLLRSGGNRFGYLSIIAVILTVFVTISLSAWLVVGQSMAYSPLATAAKERLILVQQESTQEEAKPENSSKEEAKPESSSKEEAKPESSSKEEEAKPENSSKEEAKPENSSKEEAKPENSSKEEAKPENSSKEEVKPENSSKEEAKPENSSKEEAKPESSSKEEEAKPESSSKEEAKPENSSKEEAQSEEELPLSETKKSLEEEITEKYEEWESQRTSSEISHSISAISTILMTVFIAMLGIGLFTLPYGKQMIIIFAIIAVVIQFNVNIFLLHKSLGGYKILEQQGLAIKNKLASARTNEELKEIREQFQELVLESINIE